MTMSGRFLNSEQAKQEQAADTSELERLRVEVEALRNENSVLKTQLAQYSLKALELETRALTLERELVTLRLQPFDCDSKSIEPPLRASAEDLMEDGNDNG